MPYTLFLATRYLTGLRRSGGFVSAIAIISILGVAVGVAALITVIAVMSGFDADLEDKIVGTNPHLMVQKSEGIVQTPMLLDEILDTPGVVAAAPYIQTQVLIQRDKAGYGVLLRGIDPTQEADITKLAQNVSEGAWPPAANEILVGSELAKSWGLFPGAEVELVTGQRRKGYPVQVAGVFTTGMYEYDMHLVVTTVGTVQELLEETAVTGIGVRIERAIDANQLKKTLQAKLGYPYWVTSWMDLNKNLFAALKLEKIVMFLILTLIVLVACFNIIATLLMLVVQKTKEVGILKSLGATQGSVRLLFTWVGLWIGGFGTALGVGLGVGLCHLLENYQFVQLPAEIYYIDRLPVLLRWEDIGLIVGAALLLSLISCWYPAWIASRLKPAEALRYE